ncbi:hypothetical protein K1719_045000 [Acacia pycnantha]|nr:hypothetical protein K1719_045000 [Acacia pycnantha]
MDIPQLSSAMDFELSLQRKFIQSKDSTKVFVSFEFFRKLCDHSHHGDWVKNEFECFEEPLKKMWKPSDVDSIRNESFNPYEEDNQTHFSLRQGFIENARIDARKVLEILGQDDSEADARLVLDKLHITPSGLLLREHEAYRHTTNSYHLIFKIFAECDEFKAMWRLVDEMIEKGIPATALTFNILICTCGEAGLPRRLVERIIKSKTFMFRPLKHSYDAILHGLLFLNHYNLIEWVYNRMLFEGLSSDTFTYNIVMYAKYRLGKLDQFNRLLDEMGRNGFSPDFRTYNILLHVLGKGDKPLAALKLFNHMRETDVVAYTVMITGYVMAGELEKAQEMFNEMISKEQVPNMYTYNSMIRGYLTDKISYATSAIADKAVSAKNAVTSKLGYGENRADRYNEKETSEGENQTSYTQKLSSAPSAIAGKDVGDNKDERQNEKETRQGENQSSYTEKLSYAASAIADKSVSAKNAVTSKLDYGSGSGGNNARTTHEDHPKTEVANASTAEYGMKITESLTEKLSPVYSKVAGVGSTVKSRLSTSSTNETDKGVSVKDYFAEKLRPGDEDRALFEMISEALHKGGGGGEAAVAKESGGDNHEGRKMTDVISDVIHDRDERLVETVHRPLGKVTESEEVKRRLGGESESERRYEEGYENSSEKGVVGKLKDAAGSLFGTSSQENQSSSQDTGGRRL